MLVGVVLLLVTGFAASACLLTGLLLDGDPRSVLHQATRLAWVLAAAAVTAVGALAWSRALGSGRTTSLLLAAASTGLWSAVALVAGWDPVR